MRIFSQQITFSEGVYTATLDGVNIGTWRNEFATKQEADAWVEEAIRLINGEPKEAKDYLDRDAL
jgi:hypothetical protein